MKAHANYGYMRKIHKQSNINREKYVRKYWDLESVILLEESGILLMIGIRNLNASDIRNPPLVSRIQNFLGLSFMGRVVVGDGFYILTQLFMSYKKCILRTWTISDSRVSYIKPWVLTAQRREYDLNGIPYRVHWMEKRLTAQHERLIPIIWGNICDCNTGIIAGNIPIWLQSKVEEAKFNDVPAGNCDIPGTFAVLRVVTWKIWTWKESTKTIQIFAGDTSCEQKTYAF